MAKQTGNVVTFRLSGKTGDQLLFRQADGKTVVSKIMQQPKNLSEKQREHQRLFKKTAIYGKAATAEEETKEIYAATAAKKKRTPLIVAVTDCLNVPEIKSIDLSDFCGNQGDVIKVTTSDDVTVKSIHLSIINPDGSIVENGEAVADDSGHIWTYAAVANNDSFDGDKIVVTESDLSGNTVEETKTAN
jgi:hypothetical protein